MVSCLFVRDTPETQNQIFIDSGRYTAERRSALRDVHLTGKTALRANAC